MKKIIILDFQTAEVHIFDYDPTVYESYEEFYSSNEATDLGLRETNCETMVVDQLILHIH